VLLQRNTLEAKSGTKAHASSPPTIWSYDWVPQRAESGLISDRDRRAMENPLARYLDKIIGTPPEEIKPVDA
jgi:hypothetical protein